MMLPEYICASQIPPPAPLQQTADHLGQTSGARLHFYSNLTTFSPNGLKHLILGICFLGVFWLH